MTQIIIPLGYLPQSSSGSFTRIIYYSFNFNQGQAQVILQSIRDISLSLSSIEAITKIILWLIHQIIGNQVKIKFFFLLLQPQIISRDFLYSFIFLPFTLYTIQDLNKQWSPYYLYNHRLNLNIPLLIKSLIFILFDSSKGKLSVIITPSCLNLTAKVQLSSSFLIIYAIVMESFIFSNNSCQILSVYDFVSSSLGCNPYSSLSL